MLGEAEVLEMVNGLAAPLYERSDSVVFQVLFEAVPIVGFDLVVLIDIEMIGVGVGGGGKDDLGNATELLGVVGGDATAARHDLAVLRQLEIEDGGLQVVESGIHPPRDDVSTAIAAVVTELGQLLAKFIVIGNDDAAVPETPEDLCGIEADGRGNAEGAGGAALEFGPESLGGILDDEQPVPIGDGLEPVHIAGSPVELGGHQETRAGGDGRGRSVGVHQMIRAAFDRDGYAPSEVNRSGGSDHGVRGDNDLVAGGDPSSAERQRETVGRVADAKSVPRTEEARQIGFESGEVRLEDKGTACSDAPENVNERILIFGEDPVVGEKRHSPR